MTQTSLPTLLLALLASGVLRAQSATPLPTSTLEPVIVTATLHEEPVSNVPYSVSTIDANRLMELSASSFPESLKEVPGVLFQQTANGQGSPFIRGFTGFRNLALIDGIRLNNSVFREGPNQYWSTIDSLSLSSIEIVKGQGSVLFGSDSIGGTVNALTKGPAYLPPPASVSAKQGKGAKLVHPTQPVGVGPYLTGMAYTRYATGEDSWTGRVEGSVSEWEKYGVFVGVTGRGFGNIQAAELGELPYTGYDELGIDAKVEVFLDPDTKLTFAHNQMHQDNVWRTHRTIHAVPFAGSGAGSELEHYFDQDRYLSYLRLEGTPANGWLDRYDVTVSHHRQSEDRFRLRDGGRYDEEGFDVDTWGVALNMESQTSMGLLTYGASYYLDKVDSYRRSYQGGNLDSVGIQGPVGDDADYHLAGVFLQDQISLSDSVELALGVRYTYAEADVGRAQDPDTGDVISINDSWHNVSGSARVLWSVDEEKHLKFFAGIAQGFRAPNLSDLSRFDIARSNELEVPSPGLDPEEFILTEAGVRWDSERLSTSLAYFYTDISDMIVRAPTGRVIDGSAEVEKRNAGDGYVQGIEFAINWQFADDWSLYGSVAWQDGKVDGFPTSSPKKGEEPVSRLLPLTGLAGVRYDHPDRRWWVEGNVQITDRADRLSASDRADTQRIPPGGTPGYTLATVRGGWRATDALTLTAGVENVFNEDYRIHGSGVNEPGVNFFFGAEMRF
jgi:hemoglobin/transferrin/lactoferrin receptor protein